MLGRGIEREINYLVDSDWAIFHLRGVEDYSWKLDEFRADGLALSIVSVAEVYEGVYHSRNLERSERYLEEFLSTDLTILPLDVEVCRIFARERMRLRSQGTPIGDMDLLIAATALRHNLIVLTNNLRHFSRVQGLGIISMQQTGEDRNGRTGR